MTNWTCAVFWEATTGSCVPVFIDSTFIGCTEAFTWNMIKIVAITARILWVFSTDARASFSVVDWVNSFIAAVNRSTCASAELTVPRKVLSAFLWGANAAASFLMPMMIQLACVLFAEAATVWWLFQVNSPVEIRRADLGFADTLANFKAPEFVSPTILWGTNTLAKISVVNFISTASFNRLIAFADTLFLVKEVSA